MPTLIYQVSGSKQLENQVLSLDLVLDSCKNIKNLISALSCHCSNIIADQNVTNLSKVLTIIVIIQKDSRKPYDICDNDPICKSNYLFG